MGDRREEKEIMICRRVDGVCTYVLNSLLIGRGTDCTWQLGAAATCQSCIFMESLGWTI